MIDDRYGYDLLGKPTRSPLTKAFDIFHHLSQCTGSEQDPGVCVSYRKYELLCFVRIFKIDRYRYIAIFICIVWSVINPQFQIAVFVDYFVTSLLLRNMKSRTRIGL